MSAERDADRQITQADKRRSNSRMQLSVLWMLSMLLFPILLIQGILVRRTAVRLADAGPPEKGVFGDEPVEHSILGLGDSVIAGTGLDSLADTVTAQVARELHLETGLTAAWHASGVNGHTLGDLVDRLKRGEAGITRHDYILVSIGVNDVTRLTGLLRWQLQLTELVSLLRPLARKRIVLLGVPPMEEFTALPQPLRWVLGIRAAMLDKSLQQVAELLADVEWFSPALQFEPAYLARDGYHPSELACREMAQHLLPFLADPGSRVQRQ